MNFYKAGPNKRVFAFLLDSLIGCAIGIISSLAGLKIHWIVWATYILFKDIYNGRSVGKLCAGIQIIDEEGKPSNFTQTVMRNIFMIIPLFPLIEYFVMVQDSEGKRLGDKVAKTRVNDLDPEQRDEAYLLLSIGCVILMFLAWKAFLNICAVLK